MPRWFLRSFVGLAAILGLPSCGTPPPMRFDSGPPVGIANNATTAVFEGQGHVVTVLSAPGEDFAGSTITSEDGALAVLESVCAGSECAVVVQVLDTVPDVGRSVPSPIDATNRYLRITQADGDTFRALFSVAPLDAIVNGGDMASVRGTYFAASVESVPDTVFRGALGLEPVRWFVFGDALLRGAIDVSADGPMPGPGGNAGAALGSSTTEPQDGNSGSASDGAGGGGSAEPGEPGEGTTDVSGGEAFAPGCAFDAFVDACGGGGGGSADGTGGGGGGTFTLIALGTLDADVMVDATGGNGFEGGGGGGGGRVFVTGSTSTGAGVRADVAGGTGGPRTGAAGGAGGAGEVSTAPLVDTPAAWIMRDPSLTVTGRAAPATQVEVETLDGAILGMAPTAADGTFSITVTLSAGLNRLRVIELSGATERRAWSGNHFEFERRGVDLFPVGGLLDVAYLP